VTSVLESPPTTAPPREPEPLQRSLWWPAIELIGSMRVAVVLLIYLGVVTFFGTFAQREWDAFTVQKELFEAWWAWTPPSLPFGIPSGLPMPGGLLTMTLLFCNLVVGGLVRIRWRRRNTGILITHLGMVLLLLAGWVKYQFSVSGFLSLYVGTSGNTFHSFHETELALVQQDGGRVTERVVPEPVLAGAASAPLPIATGDLPFELTVSHWSEDCRPVTAPTADHGGRPVLDGAFLMPVPAESMPEKVEERFPGCYARLVEKKTGAVHEAMLWSRENPPLFQNSAPWQFEVDGRRFGLILRRRVFDLPFTVRLDDFSKTDHPGTDNPRDYSSRVTVLDEHGARPVHIFMNNPLRKDGLVFYQSSWGPPPEMQRRMDPSQPVRYWSQFEVADNPSDQWPKWACYVIAFGLVVHFSSKLRGYIRAQLRNRVSARGAA
jgi:hypothetical protein